MPPLSRTYAVVDVPVVEDLVLELLVVLVTNVLLVKLAAEDLVVAVLAAFATDVLLVEVKVEDLVVVARLELDVAAVEWVA